MISRTTKIKHTLLALGPLIWVGISIGNLGLVAMWLPEILGTAHLTPFIPNSVMLGSIFIFFVGVTQLFFIAIQNVLIKEY